jgi:cation diffusion facilitator family transporter
MADASNLRAILFALGANFSIFVAKSAAAAITGSGAMFAEAVHSLSDCGNQGLLLLGMRQSRRPATADAPLGFGKAVYFWSFLVALMLFTLGGVFALWEGFHKLAHPEPLQHPWLAVGVLVFSMAAEGAALRTCVQIIDLRRGERSLWQWFRTTRQVDLVVIFGEDVAALVGLAVALGAIALTMITGDPFYDAVGTLVVGALLVVVAIFVAIEVHDMLIGQSAPPAMVAQMEAFLAARPEVGKVFSVITLQLGPDVMIAVKALMRETAAAPVLLDDINRVEAALKAEFPLVRWCFFEPDVRD